MLTQRLQVEELADVEPEEGKEVGVQDYHELLKTSAAI